MSSDISMVSELWQGTQMKPDLFEPATAEWAGRVAQNAGWLFARQQQVIFADGGNRGYSVETSEWESVQVMSRKFWINEALGTFWFSFVLQIAGNNPKTVVSGTIMTGYGNGWSHVVTAETSTYTSSGTCSMFLVPDPDWYKYNLRRVGWLEIELKSYSVGDPPTLVTNNIWQCSFLGLPRK